jgi:GxxExxY protein
LSHNEIITAILDEAFHVHRKVGPGMLEHVYKTCLSYRLRKRGISVDTERAIPVIFEDVRMDCGYRADMIVEGSVVVELKCIIGIGPLQVAQVLTYLRFLNLRHGLILNFDVLQLKEGIKRVING